MSRGNMAIRRWRILCVDDAAGPGNVVIGRASEYLAATVRNALDSDSITTDDDPFPVVSFIHSGVRTLPLAWRHVAAFSRVEEFPDLALLDIRMDGNVGDASRNQYDDRREMVDLVESDRQAYLDLIALKAEILTEIDQRFEADREYAKRREPAVHVGQYREQLTERERRQASELSDLYRAFESFSILRAEIESEIECSSSELKAEGTKRKLGFLSRGGIFLGELLRARARRFGSEEPIIIYYSGSPAARSAMLPPVLVGREELFSKGEFSLMQFISLRLEKRARALVRRQVVSEGQKAILRNAIAVLRDKSLLSEKDTARLLCEEVIFTDETGRGWTVAGLFPGSVCWALGSKVYSLKRCKRGRFKRDQLAHELEELVPDIATGARQVLRSEPWGGIFHFADVLLGTSGDRFNVWRGDLGVGALSRHDRQAFEDWARPHCDRMARELRGVFPEKSNGGILSRTDSRQIAAALLARFMAFFDTAGGSKVDDLPGTITEGWGFGNSSWIRADVPGILAELVVSSSSPKLRAVQGRFEGFSLEHRELRRNSGEHPAYWFCLTEAFEYFVSDPAAPKPSETAGGLLKRFVCTFARLLGTVVWVAWTSEQDETRKPGNESGRIQLFGNADCDLPSRLVTRYAELSRGQDENESLGEQSRLLFNLLKEVKYTIDARYFHCNVAGKCQEARADRFEERDAGGPQFPDGTVACWELRLAVYRKGGR